MSVRLDSLKTRRVAAGMTITELARKATVSDETIIAAENIGGEIDSYLVQRLLDALAPVVAVSSSSVANPSVITTASAHNLKTGDTVMIAGHSGSTPSIDGERVVTVTSATTFTIPVNVTVGGTGGTVAIVSASLGLAQL